jgi:hypothetical protein
MRIKETVNREKLEVVCKNKDCRKGDIVIDGMQSLRKYKQRPDSKTKESMSGTLDCNQ